MTDTATLYAARSPSDLEPFYSRHIGAMTREGLHAKADIAAELAWRDAEIARLTTERDEAREWVRKMVRETQELRCAFCGYAYPPGTPGHNDDALAMHIAVCPRHPMRAMRESVAAYFAEHGAEHEAECPEDDTCACPLVRAINEAFSGGAR